MKTVTIGNSREIGPGAPVFIVVETGTTCNGDLTSALKLVDAAANGGADAIKFQIIGPEYFMSDRSVEYEYSTTAGTRRENMYEMFSRLKFSDEEWDRIRRHCEERDILFYASVDYLPGIEVAERIGIPAYKLSSWDVTNIPLIEKMAATGKPVQVDLGPATLTEICRLVDVIRGQKNDDIILVHCSHARESSGLNLRTIPYLRDVFHCPVGYSADTRDAKPDIVAVSLGACLLEKRLTLDKNFPGHHHDKALEPDEFAEYVRMIRDVEAMLGEYAVRPSEEDLRQKPLYFVSIVAAQSIAAGETITAEMLACKRPGTGLSAEWLPAIIGRKAVRDINEDELIHWDHLA